MFLPSEGRKKKKERKKKNSSPLRRMKFLLSALVSPVCIIESLSDETVGPRLFYVNSQKTQSREKKLSKNWGEEIFFSYPPPPSLSIGSIIIPGEEKKGFDSWRCNVRRDFLLLLFLFFPFFPSFFPFSSFFLIRADLMERQSALSANLREE